MIERVGEVPSRWQADFAKRNAPKYFELQVCAQSRHFVPIEARETSLDAPRRAHTEGKLIVM